MAPMMPNGFDLAYSVIGLLIAAGVWAKTDATTAVWTAFLMVLCYCAGSVKYRHH